MRQIKFRGKRYGDGDWVYGNLYQGITDGEQYSIILDDAGYHVAPQDDRNLAIAFAENEVNVVFTQTVGQFTGLHDKNGKEIYEGDIIVENFIEEDVTYVCVYIEEYACFAFDKDVKYGEYYYLQKIDSPKLQIIGNIHDNPEILKNEER